jgi:hypothetical protein
MMQTGNSRCKTKRHTRHAPSPSFSFVFCVGVHQRSSVASGKGRLMGTRVRVAHGTITVEWQVSFTAVLQYGTSVGRRGDGSEKVSSRSSGHLSGKRCRDNSRDRDHKQARVYQDRKNLKITSYCTWVDSCDRVRNTILRNAHSNWSKT